MTARTMKDAVRDTGIAIAGIRVARKLRKNMKITPTTKQRAIPRAWKTSLIEASTNRDLS